MDNGIYVALSRQLAQIRQMAVISNNIANVNSNGYQSDEVLFRDFLVPEGNRKKLAFTQDYFTHRNIQQGKMTETGNQLDVSIMGKGYFVIDTPNGPRYTRAGNFQVDATGTLVTTEGHPVQGVGGEPIVFEENDVNIEIRKEGIVMADGQERGQIRVVDFGDEQVLRKTGSTLLDSDVAPLDIPEPHVAQGILEGSNVNAVKEITNMITTTRSVGSTSQLIENAYELQRKAVSTIAKQQR